MANCVTYFNCYFNCCTSFSWVDVKAAEGIEGVDEEEGTRKVVVNHTFGQVTTPHQLKTNKGALPVHSFAVLKYHKSNHCAGDCEELCAPEIEIPGGKQGGDQEQRPVAGI